MLQIGTIQIAVVSDGVAHVDAGGVFGLVPRSLYHTVQDTDADNLVPLALNCLLVRAADKTVVIDTGYGTKLTPKQAQNLGLTRPEGGLLEALSRLGVKPEAVDIVINTHLHGDHCGGNTFLLSDDSGVRATFPNAEYVTQRREYDDAMRPNERTRATYLPPNYQPLVESGQMRLLEGDAEIVPGIHGVVAPGHTPGHMIIRFESQGQHALFMADLATYAAHFERLGWMTAYDVEPLVTLETKRYWQTWLREHDALLIFEHDPRVVAGRLVIDGDKRRIESIQVSVA
jgi:glyoxylase-like metal-dependent hydrolase (beta-lactamase superfamily II)